MKASVNYNDLEGTIAIDIADNIKLLEALLYKSIPVSRGSYSIEITYGGLKSQVKVLFHEKDGTITSLQTKYSANEFFSNLCKRVKIVLE